MSNFQGLYDIRDYKESDKNFILATFLRGLYYGDSWFSMINKDAFMKYYGKVANMILSHPKVKIRIACLREDPEVILGYAILSKDETALHWTYVKGAWRNQGIATSLLPDTIHTVSHLSMLGKTLLPKINNPQFNPFILG